jgi:hypothetical protein
MRNCAIDRGTQSSLGQQRVNTVIIRVEKTTPLCEHRRFVNQQVNILADRCRSNDESSLCAIGHAIDAKTKRQIKTA